MTIQISNPITQNPNPVNKSLYIYINDLYN